jgi:diguanylate cyclase (GGDEF)-like protein
MDRLLELQDGFPSGYRRLASLLRDVVAEQRVETILPCVAETLRELVHCDDVVIWECERGELTVAVAEGEDQVEITGMRIRLGEGLTGTAAAERAPVVSNDAHLDPRAGQVPGTEPEPEAVACMPLIARDRLLGVLSLYRRGEERAFAPEEVELLADFAAVAALALANARTRAELETLATTDDLTGLANRRSFRLQLEREIGFARRYRAPLTLLLLDLDNFKAINDTYGHARGDRALIAVAGAICERLRASDFAARIGGDEFAILLPQTSHEHAQTVADQLAEQIAAAAFPSLTITAAVGIASLHDDPTADLLAEADRLLYDAKRAHGRHPIEAADTTPGSRR